MRFLKLDLADEDDAKTTTIEATDLPTLIQSEHRKYLDDDRLSPCHGTTVAEALGHDDDSIQWSPGDGGQYTIAVYAPDTEDGRKTIEEWLEE